MPTVILLDVSLSMCRTIKNSTSNNKDASNESLEVKQLANVGIGSMLDYFAQNAQLEYTALLVFSSLWEVRHQFTRHHESVKNGIYDLELYDKSNIVNAIRGALSLKLGEWVQNGPINIVLITDGQMHHESMREKARAAGISLALLKDDDFDDIGLGELEGQFDFPCKIQVICLTPPREPALKHSIPFYKKLVSIVDKSTPDCPVIVGSKVKNFKQSAIWLLESDSMGISIQSVEDLFSRMVELHYKPYHTTLSCGHLSSLVMLSPSPTDCLLEPLKNEFDAIKNQEASKVDQSKETYVSAINKVRLFRLSDEINICGFMALSEIASPAVISRHLVIPIVNSRFNETSKAEQILSQDPNAYNKPAQNCSIDEPTDGNDSGGVRNGRLLTKSKTNDNDAPRTSGKHSTSAENMIDQDVAKQPSFAVLLHNCLKQENLVAICTVGKNDEINEDWFGMLHPHTDSKKRSSLMLSLMIPGPAPILWLPTFKTMGSSQLNADLPPAIRDKISANPRGPLKSYSSNSVIWLDPESVQADVQKIVRHAKRSPDKAPHFYKELNRIRRAAISYGFYDILFGLADILEREKRVMLMDAKGTSQEMLRHIDHVVTCLRGTLDETSYDTNIIPMLSDLTPPPQPLAIPTTSTPS